MKTTFVSTQALSNTMRLSMLRTQADLAVAQKEIASGRHADIGLELGSRTGLTVSLRQEHARLSTIMETNGIAAGRLEASQSALGSLRNSADAFLGALISARDSASGPQVIQPQAQHSLEGLISTLNTALGGQFLFAGIKTDTQPVTDYFATPAASSKQSVDAAFQAAFGFAQSDPAVASITAADMQNFLDTSFRTLFEEPQWSADWSSASSQNIRSRIAPSEVVETSANANQPAIKKLAMAYTMVTDLGTEQLNQGAFQTVVDAAVQLVGEAVGNLTTLQARLGTSQERVDHANQRMSLQVDIFAKQITGMENVDPYEAATKVSTLMTQVETAYALTARIQRLGLLNYL